MQEEYEIYGGFASVYDRFMDNIPYDDWFRYLYGLLKKEGICEGAVVDLACGTGEITRRLAAAGYQVIGADISEEMLEIARDKCQEDVLLIHQDMRELELVSRVAAVVCICDGMNYICNIEELEQVFQRVHHFLEPDGVFIFDMKTAYFFGEILGSRTITENREDASYIWENEYYPEEQINEYLLTVYELYDDERDLFVRTDELHRQRAYDSNVIAECLKKQGFSRVDVFEAFTEKEPADESERLYFIAKK
ncbi:MAG: class I SAM-dependent methyltransferase [Butyribacter sp.]|nr:class I SAM-dependent methyltransferase [bacterium]MDY3853827.1 class I SAM-dependent methyltransferase [Butyribacter sp.]